MKSKAINNMEIKKFVPDELRNTPPEYKRVEELRYDDSLGRDLPTLVCIKGNKQEQKSVEQIKTLKSRGKSGEVFLGKVGKPRDPEIGKIARFNLGADSIPCFEELEPIPGLQTVYEAHEISFQHDLGVAVDNQNVILIDPRTGEQTKFTSPWFRNLHTAQLLKDEHGRIPQMLVSSTGIDAALLVDITQPNPQIVSFWSGYNMPGEKTKSGRKIRINAAGIIEEYSDTNDLINRLSIQELPQLGFANGDRVVSLNSAKQIGPDTIITSFHKGEVAKVRLDEGSSYQTVIDGLKHPHSVTVNGNAISSVTSTLQGIWYHYEKDRTVGYDFRNFPGKDFEYGDKEWIQTATHLTSDLVSVVDINRRQITLLDIQNDTYRNVPFDRNLSIQMMALNTHRL